MKTCLVGLAILVAPFLTGPTLSAQTLHLGNTGEPQTLDPHRYNLRLEETILTDLFMGLTTFNAEGATVPGSAESWTVSEDGLTWTFRLRDNLQWSDGQPLTAHDFVFGHGVSGNANFPDVFQVAFANRMHDRGGFIFTIEGEHRSDHGIDVAGIAVELRKGAGVGVDLALVMDVLFVDFDDLVELVIGVGEIPVDGH